MRKHVDRSTRVGCPFSRPIDAARHLLLRGYYTLTHRAIGLPHSIELCRDALRDAAATEDMQTAKGLWYTLRPESIHADWALLRQVHLPRSGGWLARQVHNILDRQVDDTASTFGAGVQH